MKKIISLFLVGVLTLSIVACGNNNTTQPEESVTNTPVVSEEKENDKTEEITKFDGVQMFMGYNVAYPSDTVMGEIDYGYAFRNNTGMYVFFIAAAASGEMVEVHNFDETIDVCEEHIAVMMERNAQKYFNGNATVHHIKKQENVTINGIDMCRVEGTLENTFKGGVYDSVAYYIMPDDEVVYPGVIIGFEHPDATEDIATFMDELASHIQIPN